MQRLLRSAVVVLAIGQSVTLGMQQQGAATGSVSGRLVDATGAPLANAVVTGGNLGYREGRRTFVPSASALSDGLGNYVLTSLPAGEHFIRVQPAAFRGASSGYYPGVADSRDATSIPVQQDQQIVGIDFTMPNIPTFRVSGDVLNVPASAGPNGVAQMSFAPVDLDHIDALSSPLLSNNRRGSGAGFEIALPAGLWDIFPVISARQGLTGMAAGGPPNYFTGRTRVLVKDRDVDNVTITVGSSDVKGRVVMEGASESALSVLRLSLTPLENTPTPLLSHVRPGGALGPGGMFEFKAVPPGKYGFQLVIPPVGFHVADLRVGARSVYADGVFDVGTSPLEPIEMTMRKGGGEVRVAALGDRTIDARFVLLPVNPRNAMLHKVIGGSSGSSSFTDVAPGDYKVFGFLSLPSGGASLNAAFMAQYESFGVPVRVSAGQASAVEVRWIPAEK